MAIENVRKFEDKLRDDESMRARLKELADAFDGDREDPRAIFEAVITPLATELGLPYTYDEAMEYVAQRSDDEDLDADEVRAAAGGGIHDFCFAVGIGYPSADSCSSGEYCGADACAGLGAGFIIA